MLDHYLSAVSHVSIGNVRGVICAFLITIATVCQPPRCFVRAPPVRIRGQSVSILSALDIAVLPINWFLSTTDMLGSLSCETLLWLYFLVAPPVKLPRRYLKTKTKHSHL